MSGTKGRILFLHGYTQSSSIFYAKTSALRKRLLKLGYDVVYLNAPLRLTPADFPSRELLSKFGSVAAADDEHTNYRAWWLRNDDTIDLAPAVETVRAFATEGKVHEDDDTVGKRHLTSVDMEAAPPIVGLIGFSQGAAFAGLLARDFRRLCQVDSDLQFVVLYSGFRLPQAAAAPYYAPGATPRMLHVYGELDTVVDEARAMTLRDEFGGSDVLKHPGGHFVPNSKMLIDQVVAWIEHAPKAQAPAKEDNLDALMEMMDNLGKA